MEQFIGCDAHKKFSLFVSMNEDGEYGRAIRVGHDREVFRTFLKDLPPGSQIALETSGSYYWLVDETERAGHRPQLAHALTAKRRMEGRHKTDERDARGLAMLLRNGTLQANLKTGTPLPVHAAETRVVSAIHRGTGYSVPLFRRKPPLGTVPDFSVRHFSASADFRYHNSNAPAGLHIRPAGFAVEAG